MSKNQAIGTCPCPARECAQQCQVKKFANRATKDSARRQAGKLYMDCPDHGRFGFDGKPAMQDYILENMQWPDGKKGERLEALENPQNPAPVSTPPAPTAAPASAPKPALMSTTQRSQKQTFDLWKW